MTFVLIFTLPMSIARNAYQSYLLSSAMTSVSSEHPTSIASLHSDRALYQITPDLLVAVLEALRVFQPIQDANCYDLLFRLDDPAAMNCHQLISRCVQQSAQRLAVLDTALMHTPPSRLQKPKEPHRGMKDAAARDSYSAISSLITVQLACARYALQVGDLALAVESALRACRLCALHPLVLYPSGLYYQLACRRSLFGYLEELAQRVGRLDLERLEIGIASLPGLAIRGFLHEDRLYTIDTLEGLVREKEQALVWTRAGLWKWVPGSWFRSRCVIEEIAALRRVDKLLRGDVSMLAYIDEVGSSETALAGSWLRQQADL